MGGRGANSGIAKNKNIAAVFITGSDGKTRGYRQRAGRIVAYDNPAKALPTKISLDEFAEKARASGATVQTYTRREAAEMDRTYWEKRAKTPDYELGVGVEDNRQNRKAARRSSLAMRAAKRKR